MIDVIMRLLSKVIVNPTTDCWEWQGYKNKAGYGRLWYAGKLKLAHRVFYSLFKREIQEGLELHHTCENKGCCNPEHLVAATRQEHKDYHKDTPDFPCGHPRTAKNSTKASRCLRCYSTYKKTYNLDNKEKIAAYHKAYHIKRKQLQENTPCQ